MGPFWKAVYGMSVLPLSFSTLACPGWNWSRVIEAASRYGYQGVEVRMLEQETDLRKVPDLARMEWSARRRELTAAGVSVCVLASSVRFDHAAADDLAAHRAMCRDYIEMAAALECPFIRLFGDVLPADAAARRKTLAQIADSLAELGLVAARAGVRLLLETHGDFTSTLAIRELVAEWTGGGPLAFPAGTGLVWDTHHPWRFHGEALRETWSALGPIVHHTHWKDSASESDRALTEAEQAAEAHAKSINAGHRAAEYALFGEGEFPIVETLALLRDAGYTGWYSLEWEKAWHPQLAEPEVALPQYVEAMRRLEALGGSRD